jgi:hypothetical protein
VLHCGEKLAQQDHTVEVCGAGRDKGRRSKQIEQIAGACSDESSPRKAVLDAPTPTDDADHRTQQGSDAIRELLSESASTSKATNQVAKCSDAIIASNDSLIADEQAGRRAVSACDTQCVRTGRSNATSLTLRNVSSHIDTIPHVTCDMYLLHTSDLHCCIC